jgi:c-di-GMP-binding flagellar brake protein YcgR
MWLRERADTGLGKTMAPIPFLNAIPRPPQSPKKTVPEAQLVLGQWAEIFPNGSVLPLHGFVFSLRPGEVLFTFPDLPTSPEGLEAGHEAVVRYASSKGRHTGHAAILRVAKGPPVTAAFQRLVRVETEQRRQYPRISVRLPATLAANAESTQPAVGQSDARARIRNLGAGGISVETSLPLSAGDGVDLTVPEATMSAARHSRHVKGRVLRVEKSAERKRAARVASVEFSFTSDDERDAWARLVLALQRKGR